MSVVQGFRGNSQEILMGDFFFLFFFSRLHKPLRFSVLFSSHNIKNMETEVMDEKQIKD